MKSQETYIEKAIGIIERKLRQNSLDYTALTKAAKINTRKVVCLLLPNLSQSSYDRLYKNFPQFCTKKVILTFASEHKTFGIFCNQSYKAALFALNAQLFEFIEQLTFEPNISEFELASKHNVEFDSKALSNIRQINWDLRQNVRMATSLNASLSTLRSFDSLERLYKNESLSDFVRAICESPYELNIVEITALREIADADSYKKLSADTVNATSSAQQLTTANVGLYS